MLAGFCHDLTGNFELCKISTAECVNLYGWTVPCAESKYDDHTTVNEIPTIKMNKIGDSLHAFLFHYFGHVKFQIVVPIAIFPPEKSCMNSGDGPRIYHRSWWRPPDEGAPTYFINRLINLMNLNANRSMGETLSGAFEFSFIAPTWNKAHAVADPEFPRGGDANPGDANLLFGLFSLKTAWKWRNCGPEGGGWCPPLDSPLTCNKPFHSLRTTASCENNFIYCNVYRKKKLKTNSHCSDLPIIRVLSVCRFTMTWKITRNNHPLLLWWMADNPSIERVDLVPLILDIPLQILKQVSKLKNLLEFVIFTWRSNLRSKQTEPKRKFCLMFCRSFFDLFWLFFDLFRFRVRFRSVCFDPYTQTWSPSKLWQFARVWPQHWNKTTIIRPTIQYKRPQGRALTVISELLSQQVHNPL